MLTKQISYFATWVWADRWSPKTGSRFVCHAFLVRIGAYLTISGLVLRSYGPRSERKLEVWRDFRVERESRRVGICWILVVTGKPAFGRGLDLPKIENTDGRVGSRSAWSLDSCREISWIFVLVVSTTLLCKEKRFLKPRGCWGCDKTTLGDQSCSDLCNF